MLSLQKAINMVHSLRSSPQAAAVCIETADWLSRSCWTDSQPAAEVALTLPADRTARGYRYCTRGCLFAGTWGPHMTGLPVASMGW